MEEVVIRRLMNAKEVAERLHVRPHRVYELARTGSIPVIRHRRSMRFDPAALHEFIEMGGTGYDPDEG